MQTSTQAVRARTDEPFLERFIEAHEASVLRCASRHAGFAVTRSDDEYSVALLAFYEAIKGYDLSSVITITIDGKEIESCGDTCIFMQDGLNPEVDFTEEAIQSSSAGLTDNAAVARYINKYKNYFGKSRIVVIKSQLGQPITAFSGDNVYWEIPEDLPKMTKLMIDGKALYIHRANYQIIDSDLL